MVFKRTLRYGMTGKDVRYCKDALFQLGYYADTVLAIKNDRFGTDTFDAVLRFQRANTDASGKKLNVDGVIGSKTWKAIEAAKAAAEIDVALPDNLSDTAKVAISPALARVSATRRKLVLEALSYAFDPLVPADYPLSLYIRGANLYSAELVRTPITAARIESGAKSQPEYYDGGRKEMMLLAVKQNPAISGADCSGGIVGLLRAHKLVKSTFDATADTLASSYSDSIAKSALTAGDWVGRSGHIGIYAGGGYVVEWMGGAYGCQLSKLDARKGYNFVSKKLVSQSAWTRYRKPDAY